MRKLILAVLAIAVLAGFVVAGERYDTTTKITQVREDLVANATCYNLTTSTKTAVTVEARVGRVNGAYFVNVSSNPVYVTTTNFGSKATHLIKARGMYVGPAQDDQTSTQPPTAGALDMGRFYLKSDDAYYIIGGEGDESKATYTQSIRVYDAWK